jgi:AcrR family transcriptional regulator
VTKSPLTPIDWAQAALEAIADGGLAAVAIESLAPKLGASKGSFYWHYQDRAALLEAAVHLWEATRTEAIIAELEDVADPLERLRKLFGIAFSNPQAGRIEAALTAQPVHPRLQPVLNRVTERRIDFMTSTFQELGFAQADARSRAVTTYALYVGYFALSQTDPSVIPPAGPELDRFVEDLLALLTKS